MESVPKRITLSQRVGVMIEHSFYDILESEKCLPI